MKKIHYLLSVVTQALLTIIVSTASLSLHAVASSAEHSSHQQHDSRPDSHAPIGVMGDHTHSKGEWMFSYRAMQMDMLGNYDGSDKVSPAAITAMGGEYGYMVSPTEMTMTMHMLGAMYATSDKITWMLMLPYIDTDMDHITRMSSKFSTATSGLGDIKIGALVTVFERDQHHLHLNLGLSLPTGSIDEKGDTPMGNNVQLPYPMQLGSGTYDLMPGLTYTLTAEGFSVGAQLLATLRIDDNDRSYTLGNRIKAQSWIQIPFNQHVSASFRLAIEDWNNIEGNDDELIIVNPMNSMLTVPTADPSLRAGSRWSAAIGANFLLNQRNRIAVEYESSIQQDLDGPQLGTNDVIHLGYQWSL